MRISSGTANETNNRVLRRSAVQVGQFVGARGRIQEAELEVCIRRVNITRVKAFSLLRSSYPSRFLQLFL